MLRIALLSFLFFGTLAHTGCGDDANDSADANASVHDAGHAD